MKSLLKSMLALSFVLHAAASFGQETVRNQNPAARRSPPSPPVENQYVTVTQQARGEPLLAVRYPWARHEQPCIEVRRIDDSPEAAEARPMYFLTEYMKGTNRVAIYRCEELSEDLPASTAFTEDGVEFTVAGKRNVLGKPSVLVRCRSDQRGPRYGVRAIFCLLEAWAVDGKLLYLQLPQEDFGHRGRIEVVFYRGEDIVWRETAEWPGYPDTATGRPGDTATGRPGDTATGRPGDTATGRPGDTATGRPGDQENLNTSPRGKQGE